MPSISGIDTSISITSGRCLGGMPPDKAAKQFAESIKPILDKSDATGVNVGIECEPGLFLEYVSELKDWIDRLGHPRFGANLDIGTVQPMRAATLEEAYLKHAGVTS